MTNDAAVAWLKPDWQSNYDGMSPVTTHEIAGWEPLYSATTVAELRAECVRIERENREGRKQAAHHRQRADAAERRVAELEAFVTAVRTECFDYWNEGIRPWPHHMRTLAWKADETLKSAAPTKESP